MDHEHQKRSIARELGYDPDRLTPDQQRMVEWAISAKKRAWRLK